MIPYIYERVILKAIREQIQNPSRSILNCLEESCIRFGIEYKIIKPYLKHYKEFNLPVEL